jgi:hypothetical protein
MSPAEANTGVITTNTTIKNVGTTINMKTPKAMKKLVLLLCLTASAAAQTLVGWNNLGMHCMDDDYSVFSILPPYNTVNCQLMDVQGRLVTDPTGIIVTYQAVADPDGSINTSSIGKTNFWEYSPVLFSAPLPPDSGLPFPAGNPGRNMPGPSNEPQMMGYEGLMHWFEAVGIPITPQDDSGQKNPYPLMRLTAKTTSGTVLATTDVVLPVSDEMDCRACHASGSGSAAKPAGGWVNEADPARDHRLNILRLHDRHLHTQPYDDALAAKGYPAKGLEASVREQQKPVLCAACHASEALATTSFPEVKPLTQSMHAMHADVIAPDTGLALDHLANRTSCYQCHPGSDTRCLRGAMGAAVAPDGTASMQCQSCHGGMDKVGAAGRTGWLDEPNCQQCHTGSATQNNGQLRFTTVFESDGRPRVPVSRMFATNPDTPAAGISLYRFSKGHGGLQCSACHGSTHAEYPSSHRNDNIQNIAAQGHAGTMSSCTSCHSSMPATVTGGPHGMHPTGSAWIDRHKDYGKSTSCQACHGADLRGTPLSRSFSDQTLVVSDDGISSSIPLFRGANVSCFLCHKRENDGRLGGVLSANGKPVAKNASLVTAINTPGPLALLSSDPNGNPRTVRIVSQPQHGSVALTGSTATYHPEENFAGADSFTFAAFDGFADSNLATVSVTVGDPAVAATLDQDSDQWPDLAEYALGLTIGYHNAPPAEAMAFRNYGGASYWSMRLARSPAPSDVSAGVEFSSDFIHWVPGINVTNAPFLLEVRDPDAAANHPKRFSRIHVHR